MCALGGLRPAEALALTWADVDFDRRLIYVRRQVQRRKLTELKDEESRDVPIQESAMPALKEHRRRTGGEGYLFPPRYGRRGGRPGAPATFTATAQRTLNHHLRKAGARGARSAAAAAEVTIGYRMATGEEDTETSRIEEKV